MSLKRKCKTLLTKYGTDRNQKVMENWAFRLEVIRDSRGGLFLGIKFKK